MPERRARMLTESTMPGADYQVPIRSRGVNARSSEAPALFASEEKEIRQAPTGRQVEVAQQMPMPRAEAVVEAAPEASVAADDQEMGAADWTDEYEADASAEPEAEFDAEADDEADDQPVMGDDVPAVRRRSEPELVPVSASVFDDDFFRTTYGPQRPGKDMAFVAVQSVSSTGPEMHPVPEPAEGVRLFAGATASQAEHSDSDELDIPAFLRRSH